MVHPSVGNENTRVVDDDGCSVVLRGHAVKPVADLQDRAAACRWHNRQQQRLMTILGSADSPALCGRSINPGTSHPYGLSGSPCSKLQTPAPMGGTMYTPIGGPVGPASALWLRPTRWDRPGRPGSSTAPPAFLRSHSEHRATIFPVVRSVSLVVHGLPPGLPSIRPREGETLLFAMLDAVVTLLT